MAYDMKPVRAPRLAGASLRALAAIASRPSAGAFVRNQMVKQIGIEEFRTREAGDESPMLRPLPIPDGAPADPPAAGELARAAAEIGTSTKGGFRFLTVSDFAAAYASGELTPLDVARSVLASSDAADGDAPPLRVFIAQDREDLLEQARAATERHRAGRALGPLDGVPVAVKDEVDQRGYPTTVGTRFLGTAPATEDATCVARLRAAGALLIGKANMHELGIGVTGLNPHHGSARNPYDPAHATGGSSSGSAAAVASGLCPVAVGADGGGSVRIPAAFCGLVGLKPTFGRVSEHGAAPLCWSVAHIGPLAGTARDAALAYALMAGADPRDPNTAAQPPVHLDRFGDTDLRGVTLGVFRPWFEDGAPSVVHTCDRMLDALRGMGATVREIELEDLDAVRIAHLVTIAVEMATAQQPYFAKHQRDYGLDVRLNLTLARHLTAVDYVHAQRHRARLLRQFLKVLEGVSAIATPTTACTAPALPADALQSGESNMELLSNIMRYAPAANLTGLPAITFPAGYDPDGLPIGFHLMGRPWDEALLLRIAHAAEGTVERQRPRRYYPPMGE